MLLLPSLAYILIFFKTLPIGTFFNMLAVLLGSLIGLAFRNQFPDRIKEITFKGLGLITLVIGMQMALNIQNPLLVIFSILIGGIMGELLRLEERINQSGDWLKKKIGSKEEGFTDGLVTAFLLFCVGSVTILGALDEGIRGDRTLIYTKTMLDGFASIALSTVYGTGVLFSILPMLIFQGGLTVLASQLQGIMSEGMIQEISATGGILVLGIGFNLLELQKIRVNNFLPSLLIVILLKIGVDYFFTS